MSRRGRSGRRAGHHDRDSAAGGHRLERAGGLLDQQAEVGRLAVEGQRAGLRQSDRAQVLDQPAQDERLVEDRPEVLGVGRVDAVDDRLDVAPDDRQRRAQLMAHVGQQRPPLAFVRLQALGHRVEAGRQLDELAGTAPGPRDPHGVIAMGHPARRVDHLVDRLGDRPDSAPDEQDSQEQEGQAAEAEGHHHAVLAGPIGPEQPEDRGEDESANRGQDDDEDQEHDQDRGEALDEPAARRPGPARLGPRRSVGHPWRGARGPLAAGLPPGPPAIGPASHPGVRPVPVLTRVGHPGRSSAKR